MWLMVGSAACAIVLLGFITKLIPKAEVKQAEEKPIPVRAILLEGKPVRDTIVLPGRIEGNADIMIASEKVGRVVEIAAEKGDTVKKDQVLMRVDDKTWRAARDRAQIEEKEASAELERYAGLLKTGGVSESDFAKIKQRKEMAAVVLTDAEGHLADCTVRTPIDGVVDGRFIDKGERAGEGDVVFRVVDARRVKVVFDVPEKEVIGVNIGDDVPFSLAVYPDRTFAGKVSFVSVAAQKENNAYIVELTSGNDDKLLRPGMIVDVALLRRTRDAAIVMPLAAIVPQKGDHIAFVVKGDRVERRVVKIDFFLGQEAVLGEGIKLGERVVVEGQRMLMDGALVETRGMEPSAALPKE